MKNFCIIHILLFILLMLVYQCTHGQDFVVTTKGDTLYGSVKPFTYSQDKKVQIITNDKKKSVFTILQVRSFSYKNEKYIPVRYAPGYGFMKVMKAGYLSLLAYQLDNKVTYDGLYLLKRDGTGLEVPNLAFKKMVSKFLNDCADVARRIDDGEFSKQEIDKIVDEYNSCIEGRTIDHNQMVAENKAVEQKINSWDDLEAKVKAKEDFEGKQDALDMIADIKSKISRKEKVPNFLVEGLKSSLSQANLATELNNALKEIQN